MGLLPLEAFIFQAEMPPLRCENKFAFQRGFEEKWYPSLPKEALNVHNSSVPNWTIPAGVWLNSVGGRAVQGCEASFPGILEASTCPGLRRGNIEEVTRAGVCNLYDRFTKD